MKRNSVFILLASHLAVAALGLLLALPDQAGKTADPESNQSSPAATGHAPGGKTPPRQKSGSFQPSTSWRGGEFARAWKAVRTAKLSTTERIKLQRDLLRQWAEVDLVAAIEAALAEEWDRDNGGYYDPSGPLLDCFSAELAKDPARGWEMIRRRQFGVGTGMLRHVWISAVGNKDPLFLASKLGELSWRDRNEAIAACRSELRPGSETAEKLFAVLARLPEDVVSAEDLLKFSGRSAADNTPEALKQEILGLGPQDQRMAKVLAIQWGRQLSSQSVAEIEAQVAAVPEALRSEVLWSAFDVSPADSAENTLGLATLLVDNGAWTKLEQRETTVLLQQLARDGAAKEVADWATSLPVRKETTELFHRSVDHYLNTNMDGAREWLASIPPGVWHDRAYAEYSQQALNAHNNPDASRWALDQIGDASFKREAESWRSQWEKRTGWKAR
ncbi:hypothetical protein [Haloferula sp. BvORR071]|uniref:hypothetical protein n=1 Tax=Haloferula sp. BvORR071 TaxID=1396141 RepID=UPI000554C9A4|nr:hypothetical protein [Haloferula sp. BvORR071]